MKIYTKTKEIKINDFKKLNLFGKFKGLMFSRRENAKILLFEFKKSKKRGIHSLFVFFPFLAVWTDDKNKIIEYKLISPFKLSINAKKPFSRLIEIPLSKKNSKIISDIVGKESFKYWPYLK